MSNHDVQSEERKENTFRSQLELKIKTTKLPKARENAGDPEVIGFTFASNWSREWCELPGPITERSKARPKQSRIINRKLLHYHQSIVT